MKWLVAVVVFVVLVGLLLTWASGREPVGALLLPGTQSPPEAPAAVTVMTWNIHYGCGPALTVECTETQESILGFLDGIAALIRKVNPDIVALQEVDRDAFRTYGIDQLEYLRKKTGLEHGAWTSTWEANWVPHPGLNPRNHIGRIVSGQAILSRFPLRAPKRHRLAQPPANGFVYNLFYLHRALLETEVRASAAESVRVLNAHLEAFHVDNRMEHARRAAEILAPGSTPAILLGDMNSVPAQAKLRHNFVDEPEADLREDETIDILRRAGLQEVVALERYRQDEQPWFTFPSSAPCRRLDYIFVRGFDVSDAEVLQTTLSDHLPVVARLARR